VCVCVWCEWCQVCYEYVLVTLRRDFVSAPVYLCACVCIAWQAGGNVAYFGPIGFRGSGVRHHFESLPTVRHMPRRMNPASWVIDIVSGALPTGG
jgi:hypothetical protein